MEEFSWRHNWFVLVPVTKKGGGNKAEDRECPRAGSELGIGLAIKLRSHFQSLFCFASGHQAALLLTQLGEVNAYARLHFLG